MYELSTMYPDISGVQPEYGWVADYARTANGLPCIARTATSRITCSLFGDAGHSVTGAYLASRMLLRHHFEETGSGDEVFGFLR